MTVALIALAGAFGAGGRFVVDALIRSRGLDRFPWATLIINVTGSLLLGLVTGLVLFRGTADDVRLVIGTGFCGGYTTFSTASFETVRLAQRGAVTAAIGYALATAVATVGFGALGLLAVR